MTNDSVILAHEYCTANQEMLQKDHICGCFYCLKIFPPSDITDWIHDRKGKTAICPRCGIDSVIGESAGYPITGEFLLAMKEHWF
ncbi:MAG: cytoplasmic protein [Clostridia bacterium]|nr:cytoplasmic protein [Clostridia bacterium]